MDVGTFMQIVSETLNDLRSVGVIVDNDTAVHKILTELPQKFEIFVRTLQQETIIPMLDNLGSRLHLEESNIKLRSGHGTEEAMVMRFRSMAQSVQRTIIWSVRWDVESARATAIPSTESRSGKEF
jgi:hypothetical protein